MSRGPSNVELGPPKEPAPATPCCGVTHSYLARRGPRWFMGGVEIFKCPWCETPLLTR